MDNQREKFLKDIGYSDKAVAYIIGETNAGEIENPGAMARHQGHCGDIMILYLDIDRESGTIRDARHRITGCAGLQAAAGAVTDMLRGRSLDDARSIDTGEIVEWLGGSFPDFKMDCVELARDTVRKALAELA
jgi:nitrogen fixation protein NifU and related proteins